jgi:hypothetical protein
VDVLGGAKGLNYAEDYRNINGIMISARRTVYAYDENLQRIREPILVAIDLHEISCF